MRDRNKLMWLADALGDSYTEKPKSLVIPNWGKRFSFNEKSEITKVQGLGKNMAGKTVYIKL